MQNKVSITVPAEHRDAIRHALAEDLGALVDEVQGQLAAMNHLSEALAHSSANGAEVRLEADTPGDRGRLREWAELAGERDSYPIMSTLEEGPLSRVGRLRIRPRRTLSRDGASLGTGVVACRCGGTLVASRRAVRMLLLARPVERPPGWPARVRPAVESAGAGLEEHGVHVAAALPRVDVVRVSTRSADRRLFSRGRRGRRNDSESQSANREQRWRDLAHGLLLLSVRASADEYCLNVRSDGKLASVGEDIFEALSTGEGEAADGSLGLVEGRR